MSRRCDREGVYDVPRDFWDWTPFPDQTPFGRLYMQWDAHPDPLQRRVAHRRELDQDDDNHCAHLCTHGDVLRHLRERPVLP